jgi:predicted MFS family arabinose efflux permease
VYSLRGCNRQQAAAAHGPRVGAVRLPVIDTRLPRPVQTLQLGGLCNAFGNGIVLPFTLIYLHNVRGISLSVAGLVIATNAGVALVAGPVSGPLVDRLGGRRVLGSALVLLSVGFGAYPFVRAPWQAFLAAAVTGLGNGFFWPAQSTLLVGLTPPDLRHITFAMQRVVMNLGIGLGALVGGLIASTAHPSSFTVLFAVDAVTFLVYLVVLYAFVPSPDLSSGGAEQRPGRYLDVLRNGAFMRVICLNALFIVAGFSGFELLPAYAKNEAGVGEGAIGAVFFVNTLVIVLSQLRISRLSEGRRRTRLLALLGITWATSWLIVPVAGLWLAGLAAAVLIGAAMALFAVGECLHGAVQGPLVADLAEPRLYGRYMALSALSWSVGFAAGPAIGGAVLQEWPTGVWIGAAALCLLAGGLALLLEHALPAHARRNPAAA